MLSKRKNILLIGVAIWLSSCLPPAQSFNYEKSMNLLFFKNITQLIGDKNAHIDSVKIYRASLIENLVERDDVTEFKLINTESNQPTVDLVATKNYNHLYLMQVFTTPASDDLCIFLSTGYNPKGVCTHVGPAYLGNVRINQIDVKRELKIQNYKSVYWVSDKRKKDMNIIFYDDVPEIEDTVSAIRVKQIILQEANKIGGSKPILFTTEKIFNDNNALAFKYLETIKK